MLDAISSESHEHPLNREYVDRLASILFRNRKQARKKSGERGTRSAQLSLRSMPGFDLVEDVASTGFDSTYGPPISYQYAMQAAFSPYLGLRSCRLERTGVILVFFLKMECRWLDRSVRVNYLVEDRSDS